jgi:ribA/ribD-fused uncharacterized protein
MTDIISFTGEYHFLSNFYERPINFRGMEFKSGEHLFNALKTIDITEALWVINAPTPGIAKQRGRKVTLKPNWDSTERFKAMRSVLGAKFLDDQGMRISLLDTGDAYLEEGNNWHDSTWGLCHCGRKPCQGIGENNLGKLLMELRADLRKWV